MNKFNRKAILNKLLTVILPVLAFAISYLIAKSDTKVGLLFIGGVLGMALTIFALFYPSFGYYYVIIIAFFLFDFMRLMNADLPLGTSIDILIITLFVAIALQKIIKKESFWEHCGHVIVVAYFISFLYSTLQIFNPNSVSKEVTITVYRRFLTLQLFLYAAIQLFSSVAAIKRFLKIFIALSFITGLYACFQEWFGMPSYHLNYILSSKQLTGLYRLDNGSFRKFSFLSDPTSFGIMMAAVSLIAIVLLMHVKDKGKKLLLGIVLLILLLAMSYSGTRTAYGSLVAGLVLYVLMTLTSRNTLIFASFALSVFVVIMFAPIYGNTTINRIRSTFEFSDDASFKVRDVNRQSVQPYLRSHPIGGGIGTTGAVYMDKNAGHPLAGFPTDSGLLRGALELGWIGYLIQCSLYFLILQQGVHYYYRSKIPEIKSLLLLCTVALFSYMIAHYTQVAIGPIPGAFLFYSLIAIIVRLSQIENEQILSTTAQRKV